MNGKHDSATRVETFRRIVVGTAWGFVPTLFVAWLATHAEVSMGAGARALGILERVMLLALVAAVVGIAGLFGMRVLRFFRIGAESLFARFILGVGLGLGVISLATLALGCAGLVRAPAATAVLGAMFLVGVFELRAVGDPLRRPAVPRARLTLLELALVLAMLVALVFQLVLAFNLPTDYDACEYHLAAPWRWAQLGRVGYVPGNVYTNLPMNAEMLYLFGLELAGGGPGAGWDRLCLGVHLAVALNAMTALLATGAVFVLARRFWSRRAALAAAALVATMPWTMIATTVNIHVEILLVAWATLAVYALLEFAETRQARWAILSAGFAGLAGGVKYTALAFFVPVGAVAVLVMFRGAWRRRIAASLLYAAAVLAVVAPWFAKNVALTGNPVHPFAYQWFGGRDWSPELDWKWYAGNHKAADAGDAGNLFVATWQRLVWPKHHHGSAAVALFAVLALVAWRDRHVRRLWILIALWTLLWYFATHRVDRFWLPMAGVAAALAGGGFESLRAKWARWAVTALLFAGLGGQLTVSGLVFSVNATGNYDLVTGNAAHLARRYDLRELAGFMREHPSARVLMVGEARTLYLPPSVECATVFNRIPWEAAEFDRALRVGDFSHVFVNWNEYDRLRESYTLASRDGQSLPGLPPFGPEQLRALTGKQPCGRGMWLYRVSESAP